LSSALEIRGVSKAPQSVEEVQKLKNRFQGFTQKDIDCLDDDDKLKYDKRTFREYFKDILYNDHAIINLFAKKSIMDPLVLRVAQLLFALSLFFSLNAIFYSEDYLEELAKHSGKAIGKESEVRYGEG